MKSISEIISPAALEKMRKIRKQGAAYNAIEPAIFHKLPGEMRNALYDAVFEEDKIYMHGQSISLGPYMQPTAWLRHLPLIKLLHVSKQVREEASVVFYTKHRFVSGMMDFRDSYADFKHSTLSNRLLDFPPPILRNMRELQITIDLEVGLCKYRESWDGWNDGHRAEVHLRMRGGKFTIEAKFECCDEEKCLHGMESLVDEKRTAVKKLLEEKMTAAGDEDDDSSNERALIMVSPEQLEWNHHEDRKRFDNWW